MARDLPDRKKAKLLGFFSVQTERIKEAFLKACDCFGKMKDPASSWSVITGTARELQRAIAAQPVPNEAFARLSDTKLQDLNVGSRRRLPLRLRMGGRFGRVRDLFRWALRTFVRGVFRNEPFQIRLQFVDGAGVSLLD